MNKRIAMTTKQAYGAIYALLRYLDAKDSETLSAQFDSDFEYNRGIRAGRSEVIDEVSSILNKYHKEVSQ